MIEQLQKELKSLLLERGASVVGFADTSYWASENNPALHHAISFGIALDPVIINKLDVEVKEYFQHINATYKKLEDLQALCEPVLMQNGYLAVRPSIKAKVPGFTSDFSLKMAATKAGLGWIGKNCLLVSPQFGTTLRFSALLTDAEFITAEPVIKSKCGSCDKCTEICPCKAIKGETWFPGIKRDDLVDATVCISEREKQASSLGFLHPCGLCIKACPFTARLLPKDS